MWWGIMAQSIPDIDFIAALWMDIPSSLLAHRGFTHSLLFSFLAIPAFSMIADKWHRPHNIRFVKWLLFFSTAILLHIFIDAFNSYGVGWFEPFSHERISFNTLYVADPFFSLTPIISALVLLFSNPHHSLRNIFWRIGLIFPVLYLGYSIFNKSLISNKIAGIDQSQIGNHRMTMSTPAPFQTWLWYVIISEDKGFWTGYHSIWDSTMHLQYHPQNKRLIGDIDDHESLQKLIRFSQEFYTLESNKGTLIFNDLRFGQILGWKKYQNPFVFRFDLLHKENNELLIQSGRASGWNSKEWSDYYKVVFGLPFDRLK